MEIKFINPFFLLGKIKLQFVMKLFVFLFCTSIFSFTPSTAFSQEEVTINTEKTLAIDEVFDLIRKQTNYAFFYQEDLFKDTPKIAIKKGKIKVLQLLKNSLGKTAFNYELTTDENTIVIVKTTPKQSSLQQQQQGKLTGTVLDENGMPIPGATILIEGTSQGTMTDFDGHFNINLPAGTHMLVFSYVSYQTQKVTDVIIEGNKTTTLNIVLKQEVAGLDEVVITAKVARSEATVAGFLNQQKNAAQFSDGISAEQIAKTPDSDVGATLKRITGVTIVDNKYVVVRSMGDRWNQAVMDGVNLPSTDAYQQHFSFDIIPTSLVESVVVSKSVTPDMNSNFVGGHVEVKTKSIPNENFTSFSIGGSYNSRSTFKDRVTKQQGKYDYYGFDDGTRKFPDIISIDPPQNEAESGPFLEQSKKFTQDNFTNYTVNTPLSTALQFSLGRSYNLKNDNKWGFVAAVTHRNTQETLEIEHTQRGIWLENAVFTPINRDGSNKYYSFNQRGFENSGASYNYNSTLAGIFNAGLQLGNHRINFRNTYTHMFDNSLTQITGWDEDSGVDPEGGLPFTETTNFPVYQTFLQNKLEGNHIFNAIEVNWFASHGRTTKDTKDATFTTTYGKLVGDDVLDYYIVKNQGATPHRDNYWNEETNYNWAANLQWSFNVGASKHKLKTGYFGTFKRAENQQEIANLYYVVESPKGKYTDVYLPFSELLNGTHYNWNEFGWAKYKTYGNKFVGETDIHAPFLMLDNKFTSWFRMVWGMRAESFVYTQLQSQAHNEADFEVEQGDDKQWQFLPSVNLTLNPTSKTNIRLSYNRSVTRPQFSERLRVPYYDPVRTAYVISDYTFGGPISSVADSYDFKFEWYPSPTEIISAGIYYKDIQDPLEAVTYKGSGTAATFISTVNSESATIKGLEVELRKNFTFLGEGPLLEQLFFTANASVNATEVIALATLNKEVDGKIVNYQGPYNANRPLSGQSPYAYNVGLDFSGERFGVNLSQNTVGDQYLRVAENYIDEEIRKPFSTTDAQLSYKFLKDKNLQFKFNVKNIFDTPIETYNNRYSYTGPENPNYVIGTGNRDRYLLTPGATTKYDEGIDEIMFKAYSGVTLSFSLNYSF